MNRLVYVSESYINTANPTSLVIQIVANSKIKNDKLAITGALVFTGSHFAHIIEGPDGSLDNLLHSLNNDRRHGNISVIKQSSISQRKFGQLKLAYAGSSQYVSRGLLRAINQTRASDRTNSSEWLTDLAVEFLKA